MYPTTAEISYQYQLTIGNQCPALSKLDSFSLLHEAMYNYNKTQDSPYGPTKLAIHSILRPEADLTSKCGYTFKKTVSFDDIVLFIDEENIVICVQIDCGIFSTLKVLQKLDRSTENRETIPDPVKNSSASQVKINITRAYL